MKEEVLAALKQHRVTFMGSPNDTRFGFGYRREAIALEPFIQFRGGAFDVEEIGAFTYLGCRLTQFRHVKRIGRFCSIGPNLIVGPAEHATKMLSTHSMFNGQWDKQWPEMYTEFGFTTEQMNTGRRAANAELAPRSAKITIGSDVWIGDGAFISRGVKVGDGAIIAAKTVVTRDVEPYAIVGGIPARKIRYRFDAELIERLLAAQWWQYGPGILKGIDWSVPADAIGDIEKKIADGFPRYCPRRLVVNPDDTTKII